GVQTCALPICRKRRGRSVVGAGLLLPRSGCRTPRLRFEPGGAFGVPELAVQAATRRRADLPVAGGCEAGATDTRLPSPRADRPSAPPAGSALRSCEMVNRLTGYFDQSDDRPPVDDYYVVACAWDDFYVTSDVAEQILRELQEPSSPRWIRFRDVHGSTVCLRSRLILYVRECTAEQREAARRFWRAREQ